MDPWGTVLASALSATGLFAAASLLIAGQREIRGHSELGETLHRVLGRWAN